MKLTKCGIILSEKMLSMMVVFYIYSSVFCFLLGMCKLEFALPCALITAYGIFRFWRSLCTDEEDYLLTVTWPILISCSLLTLLFILSAGQGGFYTQGGDWAKHWAILSDLIKHSWPVIYHTEAEPAMLTYYIGSYLVPSLGGKIFGGSLYAASVIWMAFVFLGLLLVELELFYLARKNDKKQIILCITFLMFGTALFLERALFPALVGNIDDMRTVDNFFLSNSIILYYRSVWNAVYDVFPQAIPAWLVSGLFLMHIKRPHQYALFCAPLLITSTFSLVGICVLMLGMALLQWHRTQSLSKVIWNYLSVENICAVLGGMLLPLIYLLGNVLQPKANYTSFQLTMMHYGALSGVYFAFCSGFFCYSLVIYNEQKNNPLYYFVNAILLILPLLHMGVNNDLCMDASIPAMFCLLVMIQDSLLCKIRDKDCKKSLIALALLLMFGAIFQTEDMINNIKRGPQESIAGISQNYYTFWNYSDSMELVCRRDGSIPADLAYNYFTYDAETSVFYKVIARKPRMSEI